ncbi:MAG: lysylphosphatidylglycerol synthase transmembrane domain-containing protein [Eubacteriales bacterium]|nr:lysylphosphatidylglycerol synthase transmembrane domain-containing protein [Eubacteriales bacterium]
MFNLGFNFFGQAADENEQRDEAKSSPAPSTADYLPLKQEAELPPPEPYLSFSSSAKPRTEVEMATPSKLKPSQSFLYILGMLLILLLTFHLIFRHYDKSAVKSILSSANFFYIFIAVGLIFLMQVTFGTVLLGLTARSDEQKYPFMLGLNTAMIGFFFNNITPSSSGGQPMEIYYLYRCGVRIANASLSFIALSLFYYLAKLVLGLLAFFLNPKAAWAALSGYHLFFIIGTVIPIFMAMLCLMLLFRPKLVANISRRCLEFLIAKRIIKRRQSARLKLDNWLEQYEGGSRHLSANLSEICQNFVYFLAGTLASYTASYFCALAIGARPNYFEFMRLQSLYYLTSTALPTPGAVGLGESSFAKIFSYCLGPEKAVATMILSRSVSLYFFLLIALGFVIYAFSTAGRGQYRINAQRIKKAG